MTRPPNTRWLDRLAHDLRGPLTPLQTAAFLLRSGQVPAERQQELLLVIERQTQLLTRMIDELADWTRIANDRLIGATEACELAMLLDYARGASAAANTAIVENNAETAVVQGDPMRLTQLLRTLIEYVAPAAATVTLDTVDDHVRIDVCDPRPPPASERIATLLDEPQAEPYDEGLGLRLLVARAIAEAHGGTLTALVERERLCFRCTLPVAHPA